MECLLNLTPLFLDCPESLLESSHFMAVVQNILCADQTLFKTAKDLVITNFPGPVSEEFSFMLQKQLRQFERYGLKDEAKIVTLWLNVMTALPNWFKDKNVLFVMNLLCRVAFYKIPVGKCVKDHLTDLNNILQSKSSGGFISWLSSGKSLNSFLPASLPDCPYFAFFILEIEEECESAVRFWKTLVEGLRDDETSLEAGMKSASGKLSIGVPNSNHLSIYRWCQQLLETPAHSQMSMVFAKKFFNYFLARPLPNNVGHESGAVGTKFFEGIMNTMYLNKVKSKLACISAHYEERETGERSAAMMALFKSLGTWLEDPTVLDANVHVSSLAPIYMPKRLGEVIAGGESEFRNIWSEYLLPYEQEAGTERCVSEWDRMHFRGDGDADGSGRRATPEAEVRPHEKIVKRLRSYDRPRPPPELTLTAPPVEQLSDSTFASVHNILAVARPMIEVLSEHAAQFNVEAMEYGYLTNTYLELVPELYRNVKREAAKRVNCAGTLGPKKEKLACSGVATIVVEFEEAARQEQVAARVQQCEEGFRGLGCYSLADDVIYRNRTLQTTQHL